MTMEFVGNEDMGKAGMKKGQNRLVVTGLGSDVSALRRIESEFFRGVVDR
jgi:hypothetical protein